jgi:hypothetical protein
MGDSKSGGGNIVLVRVRPGAPILYRHADYSLHLCMAMQALIVAARMSGVELRRRIIGKPRA